MKPTVEWSIQVPSIVFPVMSDGTVPCSQPIVSFKELAVDESRYRMWISLLSAAEQKRRIKLLDIP